jgi:thymidylate synthase (FAD)
MEIIQPSASILAITGHKELPYHYYPNADILIEAAGRTCYKSNEKITKTSAAAFREQRYREKHLTVLEHSWEVRHYFTLQHDAFLRAGNWSKYLYFSKTNKNIIAGNLRAWAECTELKWELNKCKYEVLGEETIQGLARAWDEPWLMRATVRFINDRGVSHEEVRHRPPAISQESTRYVNYAKRRTQFVIPPWVNPNNLRLNSILHKERWADLLWMVACWGSEKVYTTLIKLGWKPQQARNVLINSLKTELVISATIEEWQHIFCQRALGTTGVPHPQMSEVMIPLLESFERLEPTFFSKETLKKKSSGYI